MAIREQQGTVRDLVPIERALISVYDKTNVEEFAQGLISRSPGIQIISSGGTYNVLKDSIGPYSPEHTLVEVGEYTGTPEMDGGLVKTLDPAIHGGILGERGHAPHVEYLNGRGEHVGFIDMVVVNLYPFSEAIARDGATIETARGNIDIGGPTMLRGAAKSFPWCAAVSSPDLYDLVLEDMDENGNGSSSFDMRLILAERAFKVTKEYDKAIASHLSNQLRDIDKVRATYGLPPVED